MQQQEIQLFDIYDIIHTPLRYRPWFYTPVGALVIGITLFACYRLYRWYFAVVPKTIWEHALSEVEELSQIKETVSHKEFYIRLTGILKQYLQGRFMLNLVGQTDRQMLQSLENKKGLPADVIEKIKEIIADIQEVKFAGKSAAQEHMNSSLQTAQYLVDSTRITDQKK